MATVIDTRTLTGGGDLAGGNVTTCRGTGVIPPEDPERHGTSEGSISIWDLFGYTWESDSPITATSPPSRTYRVGFAVSVTGPGGASDSDSAGTTVTTSTKVIQTETGTGTWTASAECELMEEVVRPSPTTGSGYQPDPPIGTTLRHYWRTKAGGAWSATISLGSASASISGTFASAVEIGWPDGFDLLATAASSAENDTAPTITAETLGDWRDGAIAESRTATVGSNTATADSSGCVATAVGGSATASLSCAVPFVFTLDAQSRAMEVAYPDAATWLYERAGTTAEESATASLADSRTYRSESSDVSATNGTTTDTDSYDHPSNFGAISLAYKGASLTTLQEPTTDASFVFKGRLMAGLTIEVPADSGNLSRGADSALAGSPWGVVRSFAAATPAWQGLMGWAYLEIVAAETGGASAGAAVSIKIGSRTWTKDHAGTALTTPGSGSSATWKIDLTAPDGAGPTDATLTTYPYNDNWDEAGGDEDDYYRTGESSLSGVLYATSIRVEVGSSTTLTLTSIKGKRTSADTVYATNLPAHRAFFSERPDRVVSESGTTTVYRVRPCFFVDLEGRQLAAEWSDISWQQTTGGESGVVTNTLSEHSIEWLADRINDGFLTPGWSATIDAPAPGTGLAAFYNYELPFVDLLGGGYYWERPSVSYPDGRWISGIDWAMRPSGGAVSIPHHLGFTRYLGGPGNIGDVFLHDDEATDGPTTFKLAKILRCQGIGTAYDSSGLRDASVALALTQSGADRGTGTTDAAGYGQTGTPFGLGAGASALLAVGDLNALLTPRGRHRLRLRAMDGAEASCISADVSLTLRLVRAYLMGGTIWLGFANAPYAGADWTDSDTAIAADWVCVRYLHDGSICLVYEAGGAIKRTQTRDEGGTFDVATTIAATGAKGALCVSSTGVRFTFWRDSGGTGSIKTRVFDPQWNELVAATTVVASAVADDAIAAVWRAGLVILQYVNTSGAVVAVTSTDWTTYS